jgi:hypothetical protein
LRYTIRLLLLPNAAHYTMHLIHRTKPINMHQGHSANVCCQSLPIEVQYTIDKPILTN